MNPLIMVTNYFAILAFHDVEFVTQVSAIACIDLNLPFTSSPVHLIGRSLEMEMKIDVFQTQWPSLVAVLSGYYYSNKSSIFITNILVQWFFLKDVKKRIFWWREYVIELAEAVCNICKCLFGGKIHKMLHPCLWSVCCKYVRLYLN